jgi:hypothetical protein
MNLQKHSLEAKLGTVALWEGEVFPLEGRWKSVSWASLTVFLFGKGSGGAEEGTG